jgi:predicted ArsR family transcriptional regulator
MLMKILRMLSEKGRCSSQSMAKELGIDEVLVEQMIDKLIDMGYIEKSKIDSGSCGCCSNKVCSCSKSNDIGINIWQFTAKGNKALHRSV